jgi:hypothetical protein
MISSYTVFLHDQFLHSWSFVISSYTLGPSWSVLTLFSFMISSYTVFLHGQLLHWWSFLISSNTRVLLWSVVSSYIPVPHGQFFHSCYFLRDHFLNSIASWPVFNLFLHDQFLHCAECAPSWSVLTLLVLHAQFLHCVPSCSVLTLCSFMICS